MYLNISLLFLIVDLYPLDVYNMQEAGLQLVGVNISTPYSGLFGIGPGTIGSA